MSTYSIQLLAVLAMVLILNPLCHGENNPYLNIKNFIANRYQEIPKLRKLRGKDDYQGARDNFYIATSLAANKDLFDYFSKLHWTISEKAQKSISRKLQD